MATSSGKEWRKPREKGYEFTLPSGHVATIRPVDASLFVKLGYIPDILTAQVARLLDGDSKLEKFDVPKLQSIEEKKDWLVFLDRLVTHAFVTPKIVPNPEADDEIGTEDLLYQDKLFVYLFFSQPARFLELVRKQQIGDVEAVEPKPDHTPKGK